MSQRLGVTDGFATGMCLSQEESEGSRLPGVAMEGSGRGDSSLSRLLCPSPLSPLFLR